MTENQFNGSFQNESEYEVNQYLSSLGILYRYTGNESDSPDFELNVAGVDLICEVKQFDMNDEEEQAYQELLQKGKTTIRHPEPGERLRKRLGEWKANLKKYADKSEKPLLLLIQSQFPSVDGLQARPIYNHLDKYNVIAALHGYHKGGRGTDHFVSGMLREERKNYISAVAVLGKAWDLMRIDSRSPALIIYHNKFAMRPLHGVFEQLCQHYQYMGSPQPYILSQYHHLHYIKHPNESDDEYDFFIRLSERWDSPDLWGPRGLPVNVPPSPSN